MWVQRTEPGRSDRLVTHGVSLRDDGVGATLGPQHDGGAPRVLEGAVEAVELGPVVVPPEHLGAVLLGTVEDRVLVSSSPTRIHTRTPTTVAGEVARLDPGRVGMGPAVGDVGEADVEVADRRRRAVLEREEAARHAAVEHAGRPALDLPPEHVVVEGGTGFDVIGREVDEDQGVRFHVATIAKMD